MTIIIVNLKYIKICESIVIPEKVKGRIKKCICFIGGDYSINLYSEIGSKKK